MLSACSLNDVIIEKNAHTHIQKILPGPPNKRAPITPAILPVPIHEPSDMQRIWKFESLNFAFSPFVNTLFKTDLK